MPAEPEEFVERRMKILKNMIHEIPWNILHKILVLKPAVYEEFQRGGFKPGRKNKNRMVDLIASAHKDGDGENIFIKWLDTKRKYLDIIEPFYRDYPGWAKEHGVESGKFVMPDDLFERIVTALESDHALYFMHFSPIVFTEEQKTVLMRISTLNEGEQKDPEILRVGEKQIAFVDQKESHRLTVENREFAGEVQKLREENQRIRKQLEKKTGGVDVAAQMAKNIEKEYTEKLDSALNKTHRLEGEIEKQATVIRRLEHMVSNREGEIRNLKKRFSGLAEKEKEHFHEILSKIDLHELVRSLNEPDEVKILLESLVKAPSAEEAVVDKAGSDIKNFFDGLSKKENEILNGITSIGVASVADGSYFQKWADHADELLDLKYTYRAKAVIVNLIYETLRQCYPVGSK